VRKRVVKAESEDLVRRTGYEDEVLEGEEGRRMKREVVVVVPSSADEEEPRSTSTRMGRRSAWAVP
jgi:hypothetical protein